MDTYILTNGHEVISLFQAQNTNFVSIFLHIYLISCNISYESNISYIWHQNMYTILVYT